MKRMLSPVWGVWLWLLVAALAPGAEPGHDKSVDDYNFAAWLYNQGKYPLAAESYAAFLKTHATHEKAADARFGLAQSHFYQDRFADAATAYDALRAATPDFPQMAEALFQLAQCRVALGQFAEAEALFGEMRARFADHDLADWAAARQAACLVSLERYPAATALLAPFVERYAAGDRRVQDQPATRDLFTRLEAQGIKAQDAFLALVERSQFYLGISQFNEEKWAEAQGALEAFLRRYPQSALAAEARLRLAQAQYRQEAYGAAAGAYREAAVGTNDVAESAAFELGLALHKAGKAREAAAAFAEMARRFPAGAKAAQATLYAGMFLFEAGDHAGAEKTLAPLVAAAPAGTEEAGYWLGMSLLKQGRAAEAEAAFAALLKAAPASSRAGEARLGLGDALLAQDKRVEAAQAFRQFVEAQPQADEAPRALYSACVALHRAEQYKASDDACGAFLSRYSGDALAAQVVFLSGENRFLSGAPDRAAERYRELLARPEVPADTAARARFRLAWVARDAKQFKAALEALAAIRPADAGAVLAAEVRYLEGVCHAELGQSAEAVAALEAYWKQTKDRRYGEDTLLRLAAAYVAEGKRDRAVDAYERFLKTYPKSELAPQARYQLADTLYDLKQFDAAVKQYEQVLKDQPTGALAPFAAFGIGLCRADQGQDDKAAEQFAAVAREFPTSELAPQARYRQARSLMARRQWAEAVEPLRALLRDTPTHALARSATVSLAYCLQEQRDWRGAAESFREAVERHADTNDLPRLHYDQAWAWREAGQTNEALRVFLALAEKFPADPLAVDANFHLAEADYARATAPDALAGSPNAALEAARGRYGRVLAGGARGPLADKAHYRIGWTWWLQERFAEAAAAFDAVALEFPDSELRADSLFQAGQSHARAGKAELAIERYKVLLEDGKYSAFPYRPEAGIGMADALILLGRQAEAATWLESARRELGASSSAAEAAFLMGKAQFDLQRYDAAIGHFEEVTGQTRGEVAARAQFYIGQVWQAQDQFARALVAYLRVMAIYPTFGDWVAAATFESGKCHEGLGADDEARAAYRAVKEQHGGTSWAALAAERLTALEKRK